jgi:dephospho-CoA kinase
MKLNEITDLYVYDGMQVQIDERVVTFGKKAFPKNGHIVWMAGGPGVGKGFVIGNIVAIDAKILNIDSAIEASAHLANAIGTAGEEKARKVIGDELADKIASYGIKKVDANKPWGKKVALALKDPEVVRALFQTLDPKYDKLMANFFNLAHNKNKPNILIDGTGKSLFRKSPPLINLFKSLGYETTLVYVHASKDIAWKRNLKRTRQVPEEEFNEIHGKVDSAVKAAQKFFDNVWYVDNTIDAREEPLWWDKHPERIIKIK